MRLFLMLACDATSVRVQAVLSEFVQCGARTSNIIIDALVFDARIYNKILKMLLFVCVTVYV